MDNDALSRIEERLDRIERAIGPLAEASQQAPALMSIAADTADDWVSQKAKEGIDINQRLGAGLELLIKLSDPQVIQAIEDGLETVRMAPGLVAMATDVIDDKLTNNPLLSQENLDLVNKVVQAISMANHDRPIKVGGLFSMIRAMQDPDRQKAAGFMMNILKNLGKTL